jgi:glycosyltransferase involved in cell wall biosynthesis
VSKPDPAQFAHWMTTLVNDESRWRRMAEYARESVRQETWEATLDRFLNVISR